MIRGKCHTNLDSWDVSQVDLFAAVPRKGEFVMAYKKGTRSYLEVKSVIHDCQFFGDGEMPFVLTLVGYAV